MSYTELAEQANGITPGTVGISQSGFSAATSVAGGTLIIAVDGGSPHTITLGTDATGAAIASDIQTQISVFYPGFTATFIGGPNLYTLTSGTTGASSTVVVSGGTDASSLKLGVANGGFETHGTAAIVGNFLVPAKLTVVGSSSLDNNAIFTNGAGRITTASGWYIDFSTGNVYLGPAQFDTLSIQGLATIDASGNLTAASLHGPLTGNASTATAALGLKTATTTVAVSSATAPAAGQVLTATSSTAADWAYSVPASTGTILTPVININSATSIAFDGANMWVTGTNGSVSAIYEISPSGAILSTTTVGVVNQAPAGIAFDGTNMWVGVGGNVYVIGPSGSIIHTISSGAAVINTFAFDGTNMWSAGGNVIQKFSLGGSLLNTFTFTPSGSYGFNTLAFDGTNMWVTNQYGSTVMKLNLAGTVIGTFSTSISTPYGIAFDGVNMWVVNRGTTSITELSPSGAVLNTISGNYNYSITFDGVNMWAESGTSVNVISPQGTVIASYPTSGTFIDLAFDGANMWGVNGNPSNSVFKIADSSRFSPVAFPYRFALLSAGLSIPSSQLRTINVQSGAAYTLALSDGSGYGDNPLVLFTDSSPVTVTVPLNSSIPFPVGTEIDCIQGGTGAVTFSPAGGVTINSNGGFTIGAQNVGATLVQTSANVWYLMGYLT